MSNAENYRLGDKAKLPECRWNRPTDVDWDAVATDWNGKLTAKEMAEMLGISLIGVYTASYREDIKLKRVYREHRR